MELVSGALLGPEGPLYIASIAGFGSENKEIWRNFGFLRILPRPHGYICLYAYAVFLLLKYNLAQTTAFKEACRRSCKLMKSKIDRFSQSTVFLPRAMHFSAICAKRGLAIACRPSVRPSVLL